MHNKLNALKALCGAAVWLAACAAQAAAPAAPGCAAIVADPTWSQCAADQAQDAFGLPSAVVEGESAAAIGSDAAQAPAVLAVPEPQTYALMLAGLVAVAFIGSRRRRD